MPTDPALRKAFTYALHAGVEHQDGSESGAPAAIFADADYEVGDGKCGLHESDRNANEPAIIYVRADAYMAVCAQIEALTKEGLNAT